MALQLSVLDQSPIPEGSTTGDALRNTIDLARLADALGYRRYWLAEHHGAAALACASPEAMIGPVAAATGRIRVGSGGIMLPHYSPLKVAETFGMLSALYPGRVDLGIGRAAGTTPRVALALQRDRTRPLPDDFYDQLTELMGYFHSPGPGVRAAFESPELALLGSSGQSAVWAAELGLPYIFADFINPAGAAAASWYGRHFQASASLPKPRMSVAVAVVCAESDAEALRLSTSVRMMLLMLFRGRSIPVPMVETATAFLRAEGSPIEELPVGRRLIAGSPGTVRREIESVALQYAADEVFVLTIVHDHGARRRSYELVMREFTA